MNRSIAFVLFGFCLLFAACEQDIQEQSDPQVGLENLVKEFKNIEDAEAEVGFYCPLPENLPKGYSIKGISTISGKLVQVVYHTQGNLKINYRVAKGTEDVSGIQGDFEEKLLNFEKNNVLARLSGKRILYATWQCEGYSFAASFDDPVTEAVFTRFVESIPTMNEELEAVSK